MFLCNTGVQLPSLPPLGNNTNPDDKLEFVLFFSNEYFGIKVDVVSMMAAVGAATFLIIKKKREG